MAEPLSVKIDRRKLDRAFKLAPGAVALEMGRTFHLINERLRTRLVRERLSGSPLHRRSGFLADSFSTITVRDGLNVISRMFTTAKYARPHEFSAIITPKKGPWLWIPGPELRTRAGVFRGALGGSAAPWGAVNWENVFYRTSKRNPANRVALEDVGGRIRLVATLTKSVRIPARMGLRELVLAELPFRTQAITKGVERALERVARS